MNKNIEAIQAYKDKTKIYLQQEILQNGSYQQWYDDLKDFRAYMKKRYVRCHLRKEMYSYRLVLNEYGDLIDHHSVGYLAPLEFSRKGWGGERLTPVMQIKKISDWIIRGGGRFIYVALPNKGTVYPQLICDVPHLYEHKTSCAPQWRKFIKDIVDSEIELIDIYPIFRSWVETHSLNESLFTKYHNISGIGAKLIADVIADYLKNTSDNLKPEENIKQKKMFFNKESKAGPYQEQYFLNYMDEAGVAKAYKSEASDITIFGDCNLQNHSQYGAGITANLAYNLQYPINDAGRLLIFDDKREADNRMSMMELQNLKTKSVVIYVAFVSASFVRSSGIGRTEIIKNCIKLQPFKNMKNHKWSNLELK